MAKWSLAAQRQFERSAVEAPQSVGCLPPAMVVCEAAVSGSSEWWAAVVRA